MRNKEGGNLLLIIVGIAAILFLVGFFNSDRSFWDTVNYKQILRLPCGLTINDPKYKKDEKVVYPVTVDGYINGCGWNPSGSSAGSAVILDGRGLQVTDRANLLIPSDSTESPYSFSGTLRLIAPPTTDTGNLIITSTTGLLYSTTVTF